MSGRFRPIHMLVAGAAILLTACVPMRGPRSVPAAEDLRAVDTLHQSEEFGKELLSSARLDAKHAELRRYGAVLARDYGRRRERTKQWRDANFSGAASSIRFDPSCSATQYDRAETAIGGDIAILTQLITQRECLLGMAVAAATRTHNASAKTLLKEFADSYSGELETLRRWSDAWHR